MTVVEPHGSVRSYGAEPTTATGTASRSAVVVGLCIAATLVGIAAALRFYLQRDGLWEDELIAMTHVNQPLPLFFIEVLRNDIHPPLYFLQLLGWVALGTNTDGWMLANSLLWAGISLATMFVVARAQHGAHAGWIALGLFALMPNTIWSAGTLRMYAALPAFVLLLYHANRRWFETRRTGWLVACLLVEVATAYLHAIEFFFVAFIVAGALVEAIAAGRLRRATPGFGGSVRSWVLVQTVFGLCVLPLAASALVRGSDASAPQSLADVMLIGGNLIAGWKGASLPWARLGGAMVFVALLVVAIVERDSRWRTLAIVVATLLVSAAIGVLFKPIFKTPVFAANLLPFLVLGAAAAARSRGARAVAVVVMVLLAIAAFPLAARQNQAAGFAQAAASIRERAQPGDIVASPDMFWGIARYAIGPDWGRPLAVMWAPNADWRRLSAKLASWLGPDAPARLGLVPERNFVVHDGVCYVISDDVATVASDAQHVWLVTRSRYAGSPNLGPGFRPSEAILPETFGDGTLLVRRYDRDAAP